MNKQSITYFILAVAGFITGAIFVWFFVLPPDTALEGAEEANPLYWVAPMDANYRRDKPGKSPMGMDLVPVYQDDQSTSPGVVKIAPNIVNNLGVRTSEVARGRLQQHIQTVGYVHYNEDKLVHIHPRVEGWIDKLYVKAAGEEVTENQPLYSLYSPQLVNAQEEYLLALSRNNQTLTDAALTRLQALQMPTQAIELLKRTRQVQQSIQFRSPQSGVVDNLNIREGFFVEPGNTLMSIGSLDEVWVEAEVFERLASRVEIGQSVTMTLGFLPGRSWRGEVDYLYPSLNEKTRTLRARLRFENPGKALRPNMFAQVIIHMEEAAPSILIPKEALIRTGSKNKVVLALGEGQFKSIEVSLGQVSGKVAQITKGLQEGDVIVTSAQFLLDSESSIDSDFKRMMPLAERTASDTGTDKTPLNNTIQSATVRGVVNHVDASARSLNISRGSIEKWQRGPATMDFRVAPNLSLENIIEGTDIHFTFEISKDEFVITKLKLLQGTEHD